METSVVCSITCSGTFSLMLLNDILRLAAARPSTHWHAALNDAVLWSWNARNAGSDSGSDVTTIALRSGWHGWATQSGCFPIVTFSEVCALSAVRHRRNSSCAGMWALLLLGSGDFHLCCTADCSAGKAMFGNDSLTTAQSNQGQCPSSRWSKAEILCSCSG